MTQVSDDKLGRRHLHRKADQYNDPNYSYLQYWYGREYEQTAEEIAIRRLLKGKHFATALDVGGGYGRLSPLLEQFADKVILADPSSQQLGMAKDFLKNHPGIDLKLMQADDLQLDDKSIDLAIMIRVLHHVPTPRAELTEIARVLTDDGYAIIEVANYAHFLNRLKYLLRAKKLPLKAVDIRSPQNRVEGEIPFVNHNPHTLIRQLAHAGLQVERTLSVSNLRQSQIKKLIPLTLMLKLEQGLQRPLAGIYFGPSIFFLVKKAA
jgi:ubiquinone/menaquinone biosynthesis C-methylase UbiE